MKRETNERKLVKTKQRKKKYRKNVMKFRLKLQTQDIIDLHATNEKIDSLLWGKKKDWKKIAYKPPEKCKTCFRELPVIEKRE